MRAKNSSGKPFAAAAASINRQIDAGLGVVPTALSSFDPLSVTGAGAASAPAVSPVPTSAGAAGCAPAASPALANQNDKSTTKHAHRAHPIGHGAGGGLSEIREISVTCSIKSCQRDMPTRVLIPRGDTVNPRQGHANGSAPDA